MNRARLHVPPSNLQGPGAFPVASGTWIRGIPALGDGFTTPPTGIAGCRNLLAMSPPTLLTEYELYGYSIGWGVIFRGAAAAPPTITGELALLINDRIAQIATDQEIAADPLGAGSLWIATSSWSADLINPLALGARARLSLRIGFRANVAMGGLSYMFVGMQLDPTGQPLAYESAISYYINELAGSRRL